jgi:hypothetical protein
VRCPRVSLRKRGTASGSTFSSSRPAFSNSYADARICRRCLIVESLKDFERRPFFFDFAGFRRLLTYSVTPEVVRLSAYRSSSSPRTAAMRFMFLGVSFLRARKSFCVEKLAYRLAFRLGSVRDADFTAGGWVHAATSTWPLGDSTSMEDRTKRI